MAVTIRLFAILREAVGKDGFDIRIDEPVPVERLFEQIVAEHPELERYKSMITFAVNGDYATGQDLVKDGDEVALIPPISGG